MITRVGGQSDRKQSRRGRSRSAPTLLLLLLCAVGCRSLPLFGPDVATVPDEYEVRVENIVLVSNFELSEDDPLVQDLTALRRQVATTLQLPEPKRDVTVYLFSNKEEYRAYLDLIHPGLPDRRAFFVGTSNELAVYTYWGGQIQEDLRHEATHGILHARLAGVPLWLDEGLAEYFEVGGPTGGINGDYPQRLAAAASRGWRPDMEHLESIHDFAAFGRIDYQESWAWVHYLLHASPEARRQLMEYLADLEKNRRPVPLSGRLAGDIPHITDRLLGYIGNLGSSGSAVIRASSAGL